MLCTAQLLEWQASEVTSTQGQELPGGPFFPLVRLGEGLGNGGALRRHEGVTAGRL